MNSKYDHLTIREKIERLEYIRKDLAELGNSLAGPDTGMIGAIVHAASSITSVAQEELKDRVKFDHTCESAKHMALDLRKFLQQQDGLPAATIELEYQVGLQLL